MSGQLELREAQDGTRLRLRVKAGARRNALLGVHDGALKLSVTRAPEKGKANQAVLELLARTLGLPVSTLELLAGHTSQDKTVLLPLKAAVIEQKLAGLLS